MDKGQADVVKKVLAEHGISAERALAVLMQVIVDRHVDVELRRLGKRPPFPIHNERADALKAVNDAVHQAHARSVESKTGDRHLPAAQQALMAMLMHCQFAGEKAAGIDDDQDDDDSPGTMRLVTD